ncbi:LuxR family transcriptional regulator [Xylanimonas allomyrinae]|uniref:LuxR family transcriptional regulator n=1 Tax=Xylanimonas allomyrinae TaxID=2509459 RepID=A0A4P6EMA8_9MICO|nr:LuxR family transcriptional regulator [Xylanimonas allomyrinae]QAY63844.1 LuxR family transcriptional regulator [Xylanimonas allomyrinae]
MTPHGTLHGHVRDDAVKHLLTGTSVDLQGLPGSGRSVLARAIATELEDAGWQVVQAHGVHALRDRPLEALAVAGLMARQGSGPQAPATAVSAAVQGIAAATRGGSTLLVVDDADDLDDLSAGALTAAHAQAPFPLLTTSRQTPRALRASTRASATILPGVTLQVPPLGYVDTQTLLIEALGGPIESTTVSRVFSGSGGLPALTLALAESARLHGSLRRVEGLWAAGPELWTPEMVRAVDPLLQHLSAEGLDGLHTLALAGTIDVAMARRLMPWEVLEELDGYALLRFVPRDDKMLVSLFPPAIVEYFRNQGVGARHLRVDEAVTSAFGGLATQRPPIVLAPWRFVGPTDAGGPTRAALGAAGEADVIVNRLLHEHWHRELLVRRTEWEEAPTPRTAATLLRTMLVTGADAESVLAVREATPRIGDPRDLVAFDDWYALFLGAVEHNLEWVHAVLEQARDEADEWVDLVDGIEAFIVLLVDHAPDPDLLPSAEATAAAPTDTREIVGTVRAELLLARGRSAEALTVIDDLAPVTSTFALARVTSRPWALMLEARLDEALAEAQAMLTEARREHDVEGIVGAAYVAAQVLTMRGRVAELRNLLGSVLSSGVLPALERPQHVALLSMAAGLAADEGRGTTARTLAQQALALRTGPGPFPLGSPTLASARLDGADLPPVQARTLAAERLWAETQTLLASGYLVSGYVCGMLAVVEEPTPERGAVLARVADEMPAPLVRQFDRFVQALCDGDPEVLVAVADRHADAGLVWTATRAYTAGLSALRASGSAARAAEVHEEARRRLEVWGAEAASGMRSAAEGAELTAREEEIARLAASGMTNQDIARRLLISVRTVENHLHRVFRKLGVDNRTDMSRVLTA